MKVTKRQLRMIIREEKAALTRECPDPESAMPCPIHTAAELRAARATGDDVLHWVQLLLTEFAGGHIMPPESPEEFTVVGDVSILPGELT